LPELPSSPDPNCQAIPNPLQVYAGVPLTTIAKWCGTSVGMIERHYAGVIANWDGVRRDPETQIRAAREQLAGGVRSVYVPGGGEGGESG
jgi:hypothetical protein